MLGSTPVKRLRGVLLCAESRSSPYRTPVRLARAHPQAEMHRSTPADLQSVRCGQGRAVERDGAKSIPGGYPGNSQGCDCLFCPPAIAKVLFSAPPAAGTRGHFGPRSIIRPFLCPASLDKYGNNIDYTLRRHHRTGFLVFTYHLCATRTDGNDLDGSAQIWLRGKFGSYGRSSQSEVNLFVLCA